jgi:hypothetical protein
MSIRAAAPTALPTGAEVNRNYQTAAGFDHPNGDDTETVTDGAGNFFAVWAEGESRAGGDVYFAMF